MLELLGMEIAEQADAGWEGFGLEDAGRELASGQLGHRDCPRVRSVHQGNIGVEAKFSVGEMNDVAFLEDRLVDLLAIDKDAILAAEIANPELAARLVDLGVLLG